ncbi:MAG: nucleotidyl transferase AbiEii/AbiGii toxin family protein [Elusimicrobia bacterium]|nr:nucleotidyl transferase AbiEii/AbiGii toxin family protein [Elusimicrobiota bacterium]
MKKNITNIKASVRARLQNKAKETNRPFQEVLQYYGMERFLYRLGQSKYLDKFILKGALMFSVWEVNERRATVDIDFSAEYDNKVKSIEKVIKDICGMTNDDGLDFDGESIKGEVIKEGSNCEGVRIKFNAYLNRARISMKIDVAFGDKIYPDPEIIKYPVILDMPEPNIKGYPVETLVSEKFETMIKLGALNSRMKDFYDIWLLMRSMNFSGAKLSKALKNTFEHRKTILPVKSPLFDEEIYDKNSDRQMLWNTFIRKNKTENAPKQLEEVAGQLESFLFAPIAAIVRSEDFKKEWIAPGPWK